MYGILLLRLSAITAHFIMNARAVSFMWIIAWAEPTLEEIGEEIDKADKACEKLMELMETTKIWKSSSKMPSKHAWEKL